MTKKQLHCGILTLCLLISAFLLTSFYVATASIQVNLGDHVFATETMSVGIVGNVEEGAAISFYDKNGDPIETVEPGMTLLGEFTVKNDSTFAVYYRLRFTEVKGGLADVLLATITTRDGAVLCGPCTVSELTNPEVFTPRELAAGASLDLKLKLAFPADAGNAMQGKSLECHLTADMTQVKNNENMEFDLP